MSLIALGANINSTGIIQINRNVTIDLNYKTLKAGIQIGELINNPQLEQSNDKYASYVVTIKIGSIIPDGDEYHLVRVDEVDYEDRSIILSFAKGTLNINNVK